MAMFSGMQQPEMWRLLLEKMQRGGIDTRDISALRPGATIGNTGVQSPHARGEAIDVNARQNPLGQVNVKGPLPWDMYGESGRTPTKYIDPAIAEDIERRFGVNWGGKFKTPQFGPRGPGPSDPHHFQLPRGGQFANYTPDTPAPMGSFGVPLGMPGVSVGDMGIDPTMAALANQNLTRQPEEPPVQDFQTLYPGQPAPAPPPPTGLPEGWRDPSGRGAADMPQVGALGPALAGMTNPEAGAQQAYPEIDPRFPYGQPEPPVAPPGEVAGASPITTGSTVAPPSGGTGGGMAPAMAGAGSPFGILGAMSGDAPWSQSFSRTVNNILGSQGVRMGLPLLFGQAGAASANAGAQVGDDRYKEANLALARSAEQRAQGSYEQRTKEFERKEAEIARQQQIFTAARSDPNHPLRKGVPGPYTDMALAMDPEHGLAALREYQIASAKQKLELDKSAERQRQALERFGIGVAPQTPATIGPEAAPAPSPEAFGGVGMGGNIPGLAPAPAGPAATASVQGPPVAPVQAAAPGPARVAGAEPMVTIGNMSMPLRIARAYAGSAEEGGIKDSVWHKAIEAAQAPLTTAANEQAKLDVARQEEKPKARQSTAALFDSVERMQSLAQKIHDSPNLKDVTGFWGDPDKDPRAARLSFPWGGGSVSLRGVLGAGGRAGQPSMDVATDMNSLVSQIGLATLRELKEAAKTGSSGLGGTSEQEILMLQRAISSIENPNITTEKYKENLQIIMTATERVKQRMAGAWKETYGEDFVPPGGQAPVGRYPTKSAGPEAGTLRTGGRLGITGLITGDTEDRSVSGRMRAKANEKMKRGGWKVEEVQ